MSHAFSSLLPQMIFQSCRDQGFTPTGALFPLNSYENRVYDIALEDHEPMIAKYYRPGRWTQQALIEEHRFIAALHAAELLVISPLTLQSPLPELASLGKIADFYYAFYPKFRGRERADLSNDDRLWLGRSLARLHRVGETFHALHRPLLDPDSYGYDNLSWILTQGFIPDDLKAPLETSLLAALDLLDPFFHAELPAITVHGDCHLGNILWNQDGPYLLDFDDMVVAPPVQDVWMLFNGSPEEMKLQQEAFFQGYETFRAFEYDTLILTEPLRTLRMIHHAAWIGQRYAEPAFQRAFPYYRDRRYWEEFLLSIKEQISLLQDLQ